MALSQIMMNTFMMTTMPQMTKVMFFFPKGLNSRFNSFLISTIDLDPYSLPRTQFPMNVKVLQLFCRHWSSVINAVMSRNLNCNALLERKL